MSRTEITLGLFKEYVRSAGQGRLITEDFMAANSKGDDAPVISVPYWIADAFARWVERSKPQDDRASYRLPTESEWEYAARAGTTTRYYFGESPDALSDYAWTKGVGDAGPKPVATKKANPWGLHDMYGNVAEWTRDCWHKSYAGNIIPDALPWGNDCMGGYGFVVRGGSWKSEPKQARSAARTWVKDEAQVNDVGIRLVRVPAPPPPTLILK
jgi:formylglycine-generating enzyme required for sulfatase activity